MEKFLYFADSDSDGEDAACMPVSLLRKMEITSNTQITFRFQDVRDGIGSQVTIGVVCRAGKCQDVVDRVATVDELASPVETIHPDLLTVDGTVDIT